MITKGTIIKTTDYDSHGKVIISPALQAGDFVTLGYDGYSIIELLTDEGNVVQVYQPRLSWRWATRR